MNKPSKKTCPRCKRELSREDFYRDKCSVSGLSSRCRECMKGIWKERYREEKTENLIVTASLGRRRLKAVFRGDHQAPYDAVKWSVGAVISGDSEIVPGDSPERTITLSGEW